MWPTLLVTTVRAVGGVQRGVRGRPVPPGNPVHRLESAPPRASRSVTLARCLTSPEGRSAAPGRPARGSPYARPRSRTRDVLLLAARARSGPDGGVVRLDETAPATDAAASDDRSTAVLLLAALRDASPGPAPGAAAHTAAAFLADPPSWAIRPSCGPSWPLAAGERTRPACCWPPSPPAPRAPTAPFRPTPPNDWPRRPTSGAQRSRPAWRPGRRGRLRGHRPRRGPVAVPDAGERRAHPGPDGRRPRRRTRRPPPRQRGRTPPDRAAVHPPCRDRAGHGPTTPRPRPPGRRRSPARR